jgi:recombinational DNA repair ATPase RecF
MAVIPADGHHAGERYLQAWRRVMEFTLSVRNFRGLRRVEWSPSGVCAVVGPNGSGKTTLIDVVQLLRDAYGLRSFNAPPMRLSPSTSWSATPPGNSSLR